MKARELRDLVEGCVITGPEDMEVMDITSDSRSPLLEGGRCLFAAVPGQRLDGYDFIGEALDRGARCVLTERPLGDDYKDRAEVEILVPSVREAIGRASSAIYGEPSKALTLVGVTGTNGKTTVTHLLEAIFRASGFSPGVVGTVNYRFGGKTLPAPNTTPGAPRLQRLLRDMRGAGVTHCAMEVSSHGLDQKRVDGCAFDAAVFTNLTHEHMDYHETEEEYFQAKSRLFSLLKDRGFSVINIDDPSGRRLAEKAPRPITTGFSEDADVRPLGHAITPDGIEALVSTPRGQVSVSTRVTGRFNLENILSVIGAASGLGIERALVEKGIREFTGAPGRFEEIRPVGQDLPFRAYVDYAHTPDALLRLLETVREMNQEAGRSGRVILVFGCGGNRDRTKRPEMAEAGARYADIIIVTSDNPRDEDPLEIIEDIEAGLGGIKKVSVKEGSLKNIPMGEKVYAVLPERGEAIRAAVRSAREGDIILVAGKGHEDYQIVKGKRTPFKDSVEISRAMRELS